MANILSQLDVHQTQAPVTPVIWFPYEGEDFCLFSRLFEVGIQSPFLHGKL